MCQFYWIRSNIGLAADSYHLATGLVIRSKLVHFRFLIYHLAEKLLKFFIRGAFSQWLFDVEFKVAAQTRTKLALASEAELVAGLAKMKVGERTDKADALGMSGTLIIGGRAIRPVLRIRNHGSEFRFDDATCHRATKKYSVIKHDALLL